MGIIINPDDNEMLDVEKSIFDELSTTYRGLRFFLYIAFNCPSADDATVSYLQYNDARLIMHRPLVTPMTWLRYNGKTKWASYVVRSLETRLHRLLEWDNVVLLGKNHWVTKKAYNYMKESGDADTDNLS